MTAVSGTIRPEGRRRAAGSAPVAVAVVAAAISGRSPKGTGASSWPAPARGCTAAAWRAPGSAGALSCPAPLLAGSCRLASARPLAGASAGRCERMARVSVSWRTCWPVAARGVAAAVGPAGSTTVGVACTRDAVRPRRSSLTIGSSTWGAASGGVADSGGRSMARSERGAAGSARVFGATVVDDPGAGEAASRFAPAAGWTAAGVVGAGESVEATVAAAGPGTARNRTAPWGSASAAAAGTTTVSAGWGAAAVERLPPAVAVEPVSPAAAGVIPAVAGRAAAMCAGWAVALTGDGSACAAIGPELDTIGPLCPRVTMAASSRPMAEPASMAAPVDSAARPAANAADCAPAFACQGNQPAIRPATRFAGSKAVAAPAASWSSEKTGGASPSGARASGSPGAAPSASRAGTAFCAGWPGRTPLAAHRWALNRSSGAAPAAAGTVAGRAADRSGAARGRACIV